MYSSYAELISLLLILCYLYIIIKDKIALWILEYALYLIGCGCLFRIIYPGIPFGSPTLEYMGFLFMTGIPFLIMIVFIGVETEKRKKEANAEEVPINLSKIFDLSRGNIIFWTTIVLVNLIAFLLEGNHK